MGVGEHLVIVNRQTKSFTLEKIGIECIEYKVCYLLVKKRGFEGARTHLWLLEHVGQVQGIQAPSKDINKLRGSSFIH